MKLILAVISGVLVVFSFPLDFYGWHVPNMGFIAFVALVPLFVAIWDAPPKKAFLLTFLAACIWYGGSVFWVYNAMHTFGKLPALTSVLVTLLLVVVISAYIAIAPLFTRLIITKWRGEFIVWLPVTWLAAELARNYVPCGGFPWPTMAISQWRYLTIIQIADIVGAYGITFFVVFVNCMIAELALKLMGREIRFVIPKVAITAVLFAAIIIYGVFRLDGVPKNFGSYPSFSVGMIQGNIPQEIKWSRQNAIDNLNVYRTGAQKLMEGSIELIMWTEASFPWVVKTSDTEIDPKALGMPTDVKTEMPYTLLGAVTENADGNYHNSAILFDGEGKIEGQYHKSHLVPFGEYVPYPQIFFFARKMTELAGNFLPGNSYEPLRAGAARLGMLICYEDVFPEISRNAVLNGANLLTNITNDAWFGHFSAQKQHLALSIFRAIENRRFMVRSNNSGVSAVVAPTGEVIVESATFEPALLVSPVALVDKITTYTKYGEVFAIACLLYTLMGIAVSFLRRQESHKRLSSPRL